MAKILGIDLGTTNSAMAVMQGNEERLLQLRVSEKMASVLLEKLQKTKQ